MVEISRLKKLVARLPPPPSLLQILHYWLRNLLALVGLLTLLGLLFVYLQGHRVMRQFDPKLSGIMVEFIKHSLRNDVASALSVKVPLQTGVTLADAAASLKLRANQLNLPLLGEYAVHKAVEAREEVTEEAGQRLYYTHILEFCDPTVAYRISRSNPDFLAFMPCRIALYEDDFGQGWLITMNLNLLIHGSKDMDAQLKTDALSIQDTLLEIIAAGAMGALDDPR